MVGHNSKMADLMVTRETIWAVLSVHERRSLIALAAIMVLCSEKYRHLVNIPPNQLRYREYCCHPWDHLGRGWARDRSSILD